RPDPREHDGVREERALHDVPAGGRGRARRHLPCHHAATGDGCHHGRPADHPRGGHPGLGRGSHADTSGSLRDHRLRGVQRVRLGSLQFLPGGSPVTDQDIKKGLAGVVVDTTSVSKVVQETNSLTYRGYPVQELAANCTFEEVAYLIWNGELPTQDQLTEFNERERGQRAVSQELIDIILGLPKDTHPMHVVQTAVAYLGAVDPEAEEEGEEANRRKAERLYAQLPTIVAVDHRRRHGLDPVAPTTD